MHNDRVQLLVRFGYDGARFSGLAPQPDVPTAGSTLRARFVAAGIEPKALNFAARTDAGVHAETNVATCWLRDAGNVDSVIASVIAPRDDGLTALRVERVPVHVHARGSSRGKHYRYRFEDGWPDVAPPQPPLAWRIVPHLDVAAMQRGADCLIGEHDFTSFRSPRCNAANPVKLLTSIDVVRGSGVVLEVRGMSFLRQMVRIIAGTLAEVGVGLRSADDMRDVLAARHRLAAGVTAPPHGLTLVEVFMET